jgi:hypothetical protein
MKQAYIITTGEDKYIGYGETLDLAIRNLKLGFTNVTGQYIPQLNNLEVIKINPKTIRVKFNAKEHILTRPKDMPSQILSASVTKLDNGKEWFSYASDIDNTLQAYSKQVAPSKVYSYAQDLTNALYNGIKKQA